MQSYQLFVIYLPNLNGLSIFAKKNDEGQNVLAPALVKTRALI